MTIAVDFDGTIVTHEYPNIGKPIPFAIETLKKLQIEGHHQLILWTCREGELLQEAIDYCASKGLEFYSVNSNFPEENADIVRARKLEAELFIDDRNLGGIPDWGTIYSMVAHKLSFEDYYLNEERMANSGHSHKNKKGGFFSMFKK